MRRRYLPISLASMHPSTWVSRREKSAWVTKLGMLETFNVEVLVGMELTASITSMWRSYSDVIGGYHQEEQSVSAAQEGGAPLPFLSMFV